MANTIWNSADKSAGITLTGSNLIATNNNNAPSGVRSTDRQLSGKFYWEYTCNTFASAGNGVGVLSAVANIATAVSTIQTGSCGVRQTGVIYVDGVTTGITLTTITAGAVVCVAVDCTSRLIWFRLGAAGNWNANAGYSPASGVGGISILNLGNGIPIYPWVNLGSTNDQITANFGDTAFTGAVPGGFTSGFTAGASVPTNALASQALAEHWLTTSPDARITSVVAEHWASVTSDNLQAIATQVVLEHWASVASVVPAAGGPIVTMIH
jgi:hypothetical protein